MNNIYESIIKWTANYLDNISEYNDIKNYLCYDVNPSKHKVDKKHWSRWVDTNSHEDCIFLKNKRIIYEIKNIPHNADVYFYRTYNSHGASGGNCWGDVPHGYTNDTPINFNFDDFTLKLCEEYCPNISFIKYKLLMNDCIIYDIYSEHEYYGNYSVYKLIAFDLHKFAEGVKEYVNKNITSDSSDSNH